MKGLIPSFNTLFENLRYLKVLADCIIRVVSPSPRDTVLFKTFFDTSQSPERARTASFSSSPASSVGRADLGVR